MFEPETDGHILCPKQRLFVNLTLGVCSSATELSSLLGPYAQEKYGVDRNHLTQKLTRAVAREYCTELQNGGDIYVVRRWCITGVRCW